MTDIVERLRRMADMTTTENDLTDIGRAADEIERLRRLYPGEEIERLRKELEYANTQRERTLDECERMAAEIERLRGQKQ